MGRCTHEQVDGQLGLPETVNKLGLGGGPCSQREDALWTGGWGVSLAGPSLPWWVWPQSDVAHPLRPDLAPFSGHCAPHLHSCVRPDAPPLPGAPHPRPRTCRPLLPLLLSLLALVQLLESLSGLLQPSHEPLDVVQGAVEDLLGSEQGQGSASGAPPAAGTPPPAASWPLAWGRGWVLAGGWPQAPGVGGRSCRPETHRLLLDLLSQHGPRLLVLRLPTAKAWTGAELLLTEPPHPTLLPPPAHPPRPTWVSERRGQAHSVLGGRRVPAVALEGDGGRALGRGQDGLPLPDLLLVAPEVGRRVAEPGRSPSPRPGPSPRPSYPLLEGLWPHLLPQAAVGQRALDVLMHQLRLGGQGVRLALRGDLRPPPRPYPAPHCPPLTSTSSQWKKWTSGLLWSESWHTSSSTDG